MKKLLLAATIVFSAVWIARSSTILQVFGVPGALVSGAATVQTLDSATKWADITLTPRGNKTLNNVWFEVGAVTGSLSAGDIDIEVFSDSASAGFGKPNTAIGGGCTSTTTAALPTGAQFTENTGFTCALTAGTQYHLVIKNANATPASNNFTVRGGAGSTGLPQGSQAATQLTGSGLYQTTANSGTAWSLLINQMALWRVDYSDSTSDGFPATGFTNPDTTNVVYSAREMGTVFTSLLASMKIAGVGMQVGATTAGNAPTGNPRFGVWTCSGSTCTNLGYTTSVPGAAAFSTITYYVGWFTTPITLPANTTTRVTLAETTQSDASTKNYRTNIFSIHNDSTSRSIMPFGGIQQAYCTGTCGTASNWTDTNTAAVGFVLYLDSPEFPSQGTTLSYPIGAFVRMFQSPMFRPKYVVVRVG